MKMYSQHTYSKAALISLWVTHLFTITICIGGLAAVMMEYAGDHNGTSNGTYTAFMVFFVIMLIMTPLEMVFHSVRFLDPWTYLSFQIYRVVFSLIFVVVQGVTYMNIDKALYPGWIRILNIVVIALAVTVFLSGIASLWYASVVLHRHRKSPRHDYVPDKMRDHEKDEPFGSPASSLMAGGRGA